MEPIAAALRYGFALHANAWAWPVPPGILEELEIEARLERAANQELREHPTDR